jgi:hypothetical protein
MNDDNLWIGHPGDHDSVCALVFATNDGILKAAAATYARPTRCAALEVTSESVRRFPGTSRFTILRSATCVMGDRKETWADDAIPAG